MSKDTHKYILENDNTTYSGLDFYPSDLTYSELVKGSLRRNIIIKDSRVAGGKEDCIDLVRGENIKIENVFLSSEKSRTYITAKGGIKGLHLKNLQFNGKSRYPWDVSLGDFTIYDIIRKRPKMRNVVLEKFTRVDSNKKIRVLCLHCEKPTVIGKNIQVIKIPTFLVNILFFIKRIITKEPKNMDRKLYDWEL